MRKYSITSLKGFIIGIAMLIPGVSGGTALCAIYDRLGKGG